MTKIQPRDGAQIVEYHNHAYHQWEEYVHHMENVEEVWRGEFTIPHDLDTPQIEIKQTSEAAAIIKKMSEMLSIRADKRYSVARFSNNDAEKKICDQLERFCYAYENELFRTTQKDTFALSGKLLLLRGKVGLQTVFEQNAASPKVRVKILDPLQYFPIYGDNGVSWYTSEQWMFRWQLVDFFGNLSDKELSKLDGPVPDLERDKDGNEVDLDEQVRVLQYWNEQWMAWCVEETMIQKYEHKYGRMTLREASLSATSLDDKRWSQEPFLGPVVDDLKIKAGLISKAASAVEVGYYPMILLKSGDGEINIISAQTNPAEIQPLGKEGEVLVLNPRANQSELQVLMDLLNNDIAKNTVTDVAWNTSMGQESGFRANLALGLIKDSVADVRNQLELCYGLVMGDVLWMHKKFAPQGGWEYTMLDPEGKHHIKSVTADDIGDHQRVVVKITPALPQDMLQAATIVAQLTARDPLTGVPNMTVETAHDVTGITDMIGDSTQEQARREWDTLITQDEEMKVLNTQMLKVKHGSKIADMKKEIERAERKAMRRDVARTQRDIEEGLTEDIVIPAEVLADPMKLAQMAQLMQQGMMPQQALDAVQQGLPLGMPGSPVTGGQQPMPGQPGMPSVASTGAMSPETQAAMAQLMSGMGGAGGAPQPNGFYGYGNGIDPRAAPAAMQGALPRPGIDQANLDVESMQQDFRRGALPAPR